MNSIQLNHTEKTTFTGKSSPKTFIINAEIVDKLNHKIKINHAGEVSQSVQDPKVMHRKIAYPELVLSNPKSHNIVENN